MFKLSYVHSVNVFCYYLKKHGGFEQDYVEDDVGEAIVMSLLEKQNDEKGLTTKIKKKLKEHRERVSRLSEISSFVLILLHAQHILSVVTMFYF